MTAPAETETVWLSGPILTFFNKLLFPALWYLVVVGIPLWVYLKLGHISVSQEFRILVVLALALTGWLTWFAAHLQSVGYRGRELVVSNFWRQAWIRFEDIQAVERVWWYRNRLVRIRFRSPTPFGSFVYYMPKWGPLRSIFSRPEEKLRQIISGSTGSAALR